MPVTFVAKCASVRMRPLASRCDARSPRARAPRCRARGRPRPGPRRPRRSRPRRRPPARSSTLAPLFVRSTLRDLRRQPELHALLRQDALELPSDLDVHAGQDAVEELDDGDLRAEPAPDRAELEPDDAGADDQELLRHLVELERAGRGDDHLLVDRRRRAGGVTSEPVAMTMFFVSTTWFEPSSASTSTCPAAAMRAGAVEGVDLVLLEEELDALDVALDALVLEGHHRS